MDPSEWAASNSRYLRKCGPINDELGFFEGRRIGPRQKIQLGVNGSGRRDEIILPPEGSDVMVGEKPLAGDPIEEQGFRFVQEKDNQGEGEHRENKE